MGNDGGGGGGGGGDGKGAGHWETVPYTSETVVCQVHTDAPDLTYMFGPCKSTEAGACQFR